MIEFWVWVLKCFAFAIKNSSVLISFSHRLLVVVFLGQLKQHPWQAFIQAILMSVKRRIKLNLEIKFPTESSILNISTMFSVHFWLYHLKFIYFELILCFLNINIWFFFWILWPTLVASYLTLHQIEDFLTRKLNLLEKNGH